MNWQINQASIILLITTSLVIIIAVYAWPYRTSRGNLLYFWLLVCIAGWNLAAGLETASTNLATKIILLKIEYLWALCAVPLLLMYSLNFSHFNRWLKPWYLYLVWGLALAFMTLAATNELHSLIWNGYNPIPGTNFYLYHRGPGYLALLLFTCLCATAAVGIMVWTYWSAAGTYRQHAVVLLIAMVIPVFSNLLDLAGFHPVPGLDTTPLSFAITAGVIFWGLRKFRLVNIMPVARDLLIEKMKDSIIVLDSRSHIIDINPAAIDLLELETPPIGEDIFTALNQWPVLAATLVQKPTELKEVELKPNIFVDAHVSPLQNRLKENTGYLISLHNVSKRKQVEIALENKSREMARLATTDDLTSLFNRRYANDILNREFRRSDRYGPPLSLALFDIDNFKKVNDSYGHTCGDQVLQAVAKELKTCIRFVDIAARMGGDEFLVLFPHTSIGSSRAVLDRLRARLKGIDLGIFGCTDFQITFSCGVTEWKLNDTPDEALKRADKLLYMAKHSGKDCVLIEDEIPDL